MVRKKLKAKRRKRPPKPRNPHARALKESGLFRPRVVEVKGRYKRRPKHTKVKPEVEDES